MEKTPYNEDQINKIEKDSKMTEKEKEFKQKEELEKELWKIEEIADETSAGDDILKKDFEDSSIEVAQKSLLAEELAQRNKAGWWSNYARNIVDYGEYLLQRIDWPPLWSIMIAPTDGATISLWGKSHHTKQGVLIAVRTPRGEIFHRGMLTSMNPDYDIKAIETLVVQTENTLDSYLGVLDSDDNEDESESEFIIP